MVILNYSKLFKSVELFFLLSSQKRCGIAGKPNKKGSFVGCLNSVEVVKWRVPIDRECFLAFGISANQILFEGFAMKTAFQRFFKGICGVNLIWRRSFKNPVTVWAFEGKFSFSHPQHTL